MCARTYNIRELGNEQGLVWQEVYWKIGTSFLYIQIYELGQNNQVMEVGIGTLIWIYKIDISYIFCLVAWTSGNSLIVFGACWTYQVILGL